MEYKNPQIPEGINVTKQHPLKEFFYLLAGIALVLLILSVVLATTASYFAQFVPFSAEVAIANRSEELLKLNEHPHSEKHLKIEAYLQQLTNQLAQAQDLPDDYIIHVHYVDEPLVNAFATLGGNIIIYQGLIDQLDSENALAMVIAHEIAHIKLRHPIRSVSRGLALAIVFTAVAGLGENSLATNFAGNLSMLTAMAFSREQETNADREAIFTLEHHYGHTRGATDLFVILDKQENGITPPEILSTHPLNKNRIQSLENHQETMLSEGDLIPLPDFL